jgi:hypothetical protein
VPWQPPVIHFQHHVQLAVQLEVRTFNSTSECGILVSAAGSHGTHLVRAIRAFVGPCCARQGCIVAVAGASEAFRSTRGCLACSCQAISALGAGETIAAVGPNSTSFRNQAPISVEAWEVPWLLCLAAGGRGFGCHTRRSDVQRSVLAGVLG